MYARNTAEMSIRFHTQLQKVLDIRRQPSFLKDDSSLAKRRSKVKPESVFGKQWGMRLQAPRLRRQSQRLRMEPGEGTDRTANRFGSSP